MMKNTTIKNTMKSFALFCSLILTAFAGLFSVQTPVIAEEDFGRLFSRPSERKNLDVLRQTQKRKVATPQAMTQPDPVIGTDLPNSITLQGFVKRSDGASTLWINHKAAQEGDVVDNVQIGKLHQQKGEAKADSDSLNVRITANGKQVRLKAGQIYMPKINQVREMQIIEKEKQLHLEETGMISRDETSLH